MRYVEEGGVIYRGDDRLHPSEVWNYATKRWVQFHGGRQHEGWGKDIGEARADLLKVDSPGALHYMYYDTPPWGRSTNQAPRDPRWPESLKRLIEEREGGCETARRSDTPADE